MGRVFLVELEGRVFRCRLCDSPLALSDDVLSRSFNCRQGRAYLFKKVVFSRGLHWIHVILALCSQYMKSDIVHVLIFIFLGSKLGVNISLGNAEERLMLSGLHTVEDIFCCCCGQLLGWKYVVAHDKHQRYKEGKFVLERWRIDEDVDELNLDARTGSSDAGGGCT